MQEKDDKRKEPIEMTTEEAIDYVFAPQIAEQLRREVSKNKSEDRDPDPPIARQPV